MILYEIIICNYSDDSNRSEIVLSFLHLTKNHYAIKTLLNIDFEYEYIQDVKIPTIKNFALDEEEFKTIEKTINFLKGKN
jgi:hypothetical protein